VGVFSSFLGFPLRFARPVPRVVVVDEAEDEAAVAARPLISPTPSSRSSCLNRLEFLPPAAFDDPACVFADAGPSFACVCAAGGGGESGPLDVPVEFECECPCEFALLLPDLLVSLGEIGGPMVKLVDCAIVC
jgi:hypothetical protein